MGVTVSLELANFHRDDTLQTFNLQPQTFDISGVGWHFASQAHQETMTMLPFPNRRKRHNSILHTNQGAPQLAVAQRRFSTLAVPTRTLARASSLATLAVVLALMLYVTTVPQYLVTTHFSSSSRPKSRCNLLLVHVSVSSRTQKTTRPSPADKYARRTRLPLGYA